MSQIAGMKEKFGPLRQSVNSKDRFAKCSYHVCVRGFVESDMTIAYLDKVKFGGGELCIVICRFAENS
jgi:hypothetical protein